MIKIVTALFIEASPIIQHYKLKKALDNFSVYKNDTIELIISGVGSLNSAIATTYFLCRYPSTKYIVNFGTCGAFNKNYTIGELLYINKINFFAAKKTYYPDIIIKHDFKEDSLCSYNEVISNEVISNEVISSFKSDLNLNTGLIDMEAYGFFSSAKKFLPPDKISVIKVLSDFLKPDLLDKKLISSLININIRQLFDYIDILKNSAEDQPILSVDDKTLILNLCDGLNLTKYMENELINLTKYYKINNKNLTVLNKYLSLRTKQKSERTRIYGLIKKDLLI